MSTREAQRYRQRSLNHLGGDDIVELGSQNRITMGENDEGYFSERKTLTLKDHNPPDFSQAIPTASQALREEYVWPFNKVDTTEGHDAGMHLTSSHPVKKPAGSPGSPMEMDPSAKENTISVSAVPSKNESPRNKIVRRTKSDIKHRSLGTTSPSRITSSFHRNRIVNPNPLMSARVAEHRHRSSGPATPALSYFKGRLDLTISPQVPYNEEEEEMYFTAQSEKGIIPNRGSSPLMHKSYNAPTRDRITDMDISRDICDHMLGGINASSTLYSKPSIVAKKEGEEVDGRVTLPSSPVEPHNPFRPPPLRTSAPTTTTNSFVYNLSPELTARNPHVLAHAASHQELLDRLPPGTLFQLAMISQRLGMELDKLSSNELEKLLGNNDKMTMVATALQSAKGGETSINHEKDISGSASLDEIAKELDWEAEQIIEGNGEMLGWRSERDTRYGGKIAFTLSLKINEPQKGGSSASSSSIVRRPSRPFDLARDATFTFQPPCTRGSSLFSRVFGSHRFIRVELSKKILSETSVWNTDGERRRTGRNQMHEWLCRPLVIFGRVFVPILAKGGTIFYFLEGKDRIGGEFERALNGRIDYGITEIRTVKELLEWWVPLEHNQKQGMAKLVTRLELGFSDTLPGVLIPPENVRKSDDITRYVNNEKVIFTDGAGLMTPSTALALAKKYLWKEGDRPSELPLAFQIRIRVAKGVLLVEHDKLNNQTFNEPFGVTLRSSMIKANQGRQDLRPGPVEGLHILDAACCILNVVKPAPISSAGGSRLSAQFITILVDCDVKKAVFLELQRNAMQNEVKAWTSIGLTGEGKNRRLDRSTQLYLTHLIGKSQNFAAILKSQELGGAAKGLGYKMYDKKEDWEDPDDENADDAFSHTTVSGWPMRKVKALQNALDACINVYGSAYWTEIWQDVVISALRRLISRFHLTVERSASGFFQPDPTGELKEGQVFFRPQADMLDPATGLRTDTVLGGVIIGRHPALLPTDMRKVEAVHIESLAKYTGIIFCSIKGEIPLAAICAGGDYDGDEAMIIWEPTIVKDFKNAPLHFREPPRDFNNNFDKVTTEVSIVHRELCHLSEPEYSMRIAEHLLGSVGDFDSFSIYSTFWDMSVCMHGLRGIPTLELAHKFNTLMDAKKAGLRIKDHILRDDKEVWTPFEVPIWRQRQKGKEPVPFSNQKRELPYLNKVIPVLNQLIYAGESEIRHAMANMRGHLKGTQSNVGQPEMDEDLAAPWMEKKQQAASDMALKRELDAIEEIVRTCHNRLLQINAEANTPNGLRLYPSRIHQLCQDFQSNPSADKVPSLVARVEASTGHRPILQQVKASCAYVLEMEKARRGSKESGFPWIVAMKELCTMKADVVGEGDTLTMPRDIDDRRDVHKNWRSI